MVEFKHFNSLKSFTHFTPIIMQGLAILIIIVSGNYIGDLFSNSVMKQFETNNYLKHAIVFIACVMFCIIHNGEINSISEQIVTALFIYIMFILLIKVPSSIFYIIIFLSLSSFIIQLYKNYNLDEVTQYYIDQVHKNINTKYEGNQNIKLFDTLTYSQAGALLFVAIISVIGFISKLIHKWHKFKHLYKESRGFIKYGRFFMNYMFTNCKTGKCD
jgi:hypothetical protein